MVSFFIQLFDYNDQCNSRQIQLMKEHQTQLPERFTSIFSHILNAHQNWNNYILGGQEYTAPWQEHSLDELIDRAIRNHQQSLVIIREKELDEQVSYTIRGVTYQTTIAEILFNVINHSSYHRGQLAMMLRAAGLDPLATDYIVYKMKGNKL